MWRSLRWQLGRIRVRLLVVMLTVALVPIAGLEFARLYERQLLGALERDMRNQAILVASTIAEDLAEGRALEDEVHERIVEAAAERTRTRIRILSTRGETLVDSHGRGPPEGPEPGPPIDGPEWLEPSPGARWADDLAERTEVKDALAGRPSGFTRVREREPAVFLFVTEPVRYEGEVVGVVYATRSTQPVLYELYRIRTGLVKVLAIAFAIAFLVALLLAWSISRPLSKLSRAAIRIARGERGVEVPVGGSGEIRELGDAFALMTEELHARAQAMSDFAADVAHEFKSPLTSIRGAAELLHEGAADDPAARKRFLENIELDAERLDRLVSRLLTLSRIEASRDLMTHVDVEAVLERVCEREATPNVAVELDYRARSRMVPGRETELELAFRNVVENAVHWSPDGERVLETVDDDEQGLAIRVRDRGPGIPEAHRDRVFDRFFTTRETRDGSGLGLAIVRTVLAAHGGRAAVGAPEGAGAVLLLRLART